MDYNVYNHLLTNYAPKPVSKYDAHKPSELRAIMNHIAKMTQSSPLYLVELSDAKQSYALGIKDASISLNKTLAMLAEQSGDNVFAQKQALSSDPGQVGAQIVTSDYSMLPESPQIQVSQLATKQVNCSKAFYNNGHSLEAGTYRFRVSVNEQGFDFQYNVSNHSTNQDTLGGLGEFITKANIGIHAQTVSEESDKLMLRMESMMTGAAEGDIIFEWQDVSGPSAGAEGLISHYGLNRIESYPRKAKFTINGEERSSLSNQFVLGQSLQISLYRPGEEAAQIHYGADQDKILEGAQKLADNYNRIVDHTRTYQQATGGRSRLLSEYQNVMKPYLSDMESCGITLDEEGYMRIDSYLAEQAAADGDMEKLLGPGSKLNQKMMFKDNQVKLNPMDYVDKTMVSYPDYGRPPKGYSYITSLYSGMLFNYYC